MVKLDEHLEAIRETQAQIKLTKSHKRRNDLKRHLKRLWWEYRTAKAYINHAGTAEKPISRSV